LIFGAVGLLTLIVGATALPIMMGARGATTWDVDISSSTFVPQNLPIQVGDTVVWTNLDGLAHTVTSTGGQTELDSPILGNGDTYSHQFNTLDTFTYRCDIHTFMTGSVIVQTVIPEFSSIPFVFLGILALVVGLMLVRRRV